MKFRSAAASAGIGVVSVLLTNHCGPPKGSPDDVGGVQYEALEREPVTTASDSAAKRANHALKTAFVIVMENKNWSRIQGNASAPFMNDVILPNAAMAENYVGLPF